jgi:hypothetical protein
MRAIIATVMMSGIDFSDMAFLQCLGTEAQPALMAAYIEASNLEGKCHADVENVRNIHNKAVSGCSCSGIGNGKDRL